MQVWDRLRKEATRELDEEFNRKLDRQNERLSMGIRNAGEWVGERTAYANNTVNGLSSGADRRDNSVPVHAEAKLLEKLDDTTRDAIKSKLQEYEREIVKSDIENAIVITKDGEVWQCYGDQNNVYPNIDLGDKIMGADVTHNHPLGSDNEYSFSKLDASGYLEYELSTLRGIDEKYIYELSRNPFEIDSPREIRDIKDNDARHEEMIAWAKMNGLGYRRWKHD